MHDAWTPAVQEWAETDMQTWAEVPEIAVIMPAYNPDPEQFAAAIASVKEQTYPHWHLIIVDDASTDSTTFEIGRLAHEGDARISFVHRSANGHISAASNSGLSELRDTDKWVVFLDHDDLLTPGALFLLAREAAKNPSLKAIYGDSDLIAPDGTYHSPDFKPGFDYDLLLAQNYVCHPCMYLAQTVKEIGGFREGFEGSQDYDLTLRYLDHYGIKKAGVGHVPHILYHWRQSEGSVASNIQNKPYALEAANKAVLEHLNRNGSTAFLGVHPIASLHHMVRFLPTDPAPEASILILTQTDRTQIEKCVSSILANTAYPNYQVIIRQIGSDAGVSEACARFAKADKRVKFIKGGGDAEGSFNFALLNNALAASPLVKDSKVLVFLNDDTVILEGAWLNDMVGTALRADVGAVGVKLIYPDGNIQHGGIIIDPDAPPGEVALHAYQKQPHNTFGPAGRAVISRQAIAVTAACMAVRHDLFTEIGGFDAVNFPLDYNDVDICLRLADKGLSNVVLQHIVVQHAEGATKAKRPDIMSRTAMLMSEAALRETVAYQSLLEKGELTRYSNVNLAHEPSGQMLRTSPDRPWRVKDALPISLLIGGDKEDTQKLFTEGELPIVVEIDGPYMRFIEPPLPQVGVVDIRDKDAVENVLMGLGITRIVMRRLGRGSIELLGLLRVLANDNWPVFYVPADFESVCPRLTCSNSLGACNHEWKNGVEGCQTCVDRDGSANHGYVSVASYRNAWSMLHAAINVPPAQAQGD
jgi:GT2 family glycosyltransferase